MKLSKEEKAELRKSFKAMSLSTKIDYIFTYYKVEIFTGLFFIIFFASIFLKILNEKTPVAYLGMANVAIGQDFEQAVSGDYIAQSDLNPRKFELQLYKGLYLSEDPTAENHEYAYTSRLKVLATINSKQLDLVIMNKEAYDIFSHSGYLLELKDYPPELSPYLVENEVVLEDNTIDQLLDESVTAIYKTKTVTNAFLANEAPIFKKADFSEAVYLGIIGNSPRITADSDYIHYLLTYQP